MDTRKIIVICILAITIHIISVTSVVCAETDNQGPASASRVSATTHLIGMSKQDLISIYQAGNIEKCEVKGNEEVLVFDDRFTSDPDDTITFYLVDGKVKAWDKKSITFPTDEALRSAIHAGMSKNELLMIYPVGNLKSYEKSGTTEVGTFNDILTSDPNDTITFYLVDGKVSRWDKKTAASDAGAKLQAKADAEAKLKAQSDAEAKLKAKADADEIIARAKADLAAKRKAMEERGRYNASLQGSSTYEDDLMRTKQQERASSVREERNWHYDAGLYYR